ncbi:MAG: hypothetical protein KDD62_08955, partial [Bdellovibrionales bacterium]|nr:hypothetical protein [Bdellovibrionales bacterium]
SFVIVFPWEKLYLFDGKKKIIEWGEPEEISEEERVELKKQGKPLPMPDYVATRALDGNEVSLAVRLEYRISQDPEKLVKLVQYVGTSDSDIEELVVAAARADIRTVMNTLKTSEFFDNNKKFSRQAKIKQALADRLTRFGIVIESVNLEEHRFERVGSDGSIDRSYQERINQVQTIEEDRKREESRIDTVRAKKAQEYNDTLRVMNRQVEQAKGYLRQARLRGDAYFKVKDNESKAILEQGRAEAQGLTEKIAALDGPGGKALVKLELVKQLLKNDPKFVLMEEGASSDRIGVNKVDTNDLMEQIGVFEGLKEGAKTLSQGALKNTSVNSNKDKG